MGPSPVWRVPPGSGFHWRVWDREFVLFHAQSGDTHRLNETAAAVLRLLVETPMTSGDLTARLAASLDPENGLVDDKTIQGLLERFLDLGLVDTRHDPPANTGTPGSR